MNEKISKIEKRFVEKQIDSIGQSIKIYGWNFIINIINDVKSADGRERFFGQNFQPIVDLRIAVDNAVSVFMNNPDTIARINDACTSFLMREIEEIIRNEERKNRQKNSPPS